MAKSEIRKYDFEQTAPLQFDVEDLLPFYDSRRDEIAVPHRTGFHQILWFRKPAKLVVDFLPLDVVPGTLVFLTSDTVHQFTEKACFDCKGIMFSEQFFVRSDADIRFLRTSNLFNSLLPVTYLKPSVSDGRPFAGLIAQMESELKAERDAFQNEILKNLLHNFLLYCERSLNAQPRYEVLRNEPALDYLIKFKELVDAHYRSHKQVSYYASELNMIQRRLAIATAKAFGKTPKQLIDDRLMLEAKRMLAHSMDSVKEVGFSIGFEEPTNFTKYFRKHSGITPAEFRKSWR